MYWNFVSPHIIWISIEMESLNRGGVDRLANSEANDARCWVLLPLREKKDWNLWKHGLEMSSDHLWCYAMKLCYALSYKQLPYRHYMVHTMHYYLPTWLTRYFYLLDLEVSSYLEVCRWLCSAAAGYVVYGLGTSVDQVPVLSVLLLYLLTYF